MSQMIPTSAQSATTNSHLGEGAQVNSTNNPWLAMPSESGEFETLEPGSYNGVCIGCVIREFPDYNNREVMVPKVQFVYQIVEGAQQYYLRSKPCKIVLNEKSNLYLLINGWTKATLERMSNGFACNKMVGFGAQIITTTRENNGKVYADIANVLPLKKNVKVAVTPAEIPAYLAKGAIEQVWADGITVKEEKPKVATFPSAVNDQLPGMVPQQATVPQTQIPQMPPAAQVTQNADPAAFLGVTNPPAQPATGAEAPESDDDSDLPF